jgi:hypothetical protein
MFYLVRCPHCENSDLEKLQNKLSTFKCLDCNYEFFDTEAMFDVIDDYEINKPIKVNSNNKIIRHIKGKVVKVVAHPIKIIE